MKRRDFLLRALAAGAIGAGLSPFLPSRATAAGAPGHVLVNVMLAGGPDLRHLFPPAFNADPASFGYRFWQAKATAHAIGDAPADWQTRWNNDYFHESFGGVEFGIRSNCGWLRQTWEAGHVAVVANAVGARTRDRAAWVDREVAMANWPDQADYIADAPRGTNPWQPIETDGTDVVMVIEAWP